MKITKGYWPLIIKVLLDSTSLQPLSVYQLTLDPAVDLFVVFIFSLVLSAT